MTNSNPYLPTFRSSYTGESQNIGGSSPFHIDFRLLASLPWQEKIRAVDSLARTYDSHGRRIEFSNQGVAGRVWDVNATPEQKKALYEAATRSHAARPGWDPLDFYVPFKTAKDRFQQGAVEGASIYIPGVPGGKITRGSGGGYGYFSEAQDPSGRVVFRVGHGDINRPETETTIAVTDQPAAGAKPPAQTADQKTPNELLAEAIEKLTKQSTQRTMPTSTYEGPSEEDFRQKQEQIDQVITKLLLEKVAKEKEEQAPAVPQIQQGVGSLAAAMGQKGFGTPKSLI